MVETSVIHLWKGNEITQKRHSAVQSMHTLLNDDVIEPQFHLGLFDDAILDRVFCDEPEYFDLFLLADSMSAVLGEQSVFQFNIPVYFFSIGL